MRKYSNESLSSRVKILERELSEKSYLLDKTAKKLSEIQKQNQRLIDEINLLKRNQLSGDSSSSIQSNSDFRKFKKSIHHLSNVESDINNIALQNLSFKTKIDYLEYEQKEWNEFANRIFTDIHNIAGFQKEFPQNDGDAQRFILTDLIRKLSKRCAAELPDTNLMHKYRMTKLKLHQVQVKCDRMLELLGERGYKINSLSKPPKVQRMKNIDYFCDESSSLKNVYYNDNSFDRGDTSSEISNITQVAQNDVHNFKKDVRRLSSISDNMKIHYKNYASLTGHDPSSDIF